MQDARNDDQYAPLRLENQLCFPLYACAKELVRQYRKPLEALNLTYTQYIVMAALWERGDMTEGELGRIVQLDSGTLAPLLKRLERQGLVLRLRPRENERKLALRLTEAGEALKDAALAVPEEMSGCVDLPPGELAQLKRLLTKALQSMDRARD